MSVSNANSQQQLRGYKISRLCVLHIVVKLAGWARFCLKSSNWIKYRRRLLRNPPKTSNNRPTCWLLIALHLHTCTARLALCFYLLAPTSQLLRRRRRFLSLSKDKASKRRNCTGKQARGGSKVWPASQVDNWRGSTAVSGAPILLRASRKHNHVFFSSWSSFQLLHVSLKSTKISTMKANANTPRTIIVSRLQNPEKAPRVGHYVEICTLSRTSPLHYLHLICSNHCVVCSFTCVCRRRAYKINYHDNFHLF